jgi:AcrR family transcriptional regulator
MPPAPRSTRPDKARNREIVLAAATRAFSSETEPSMRAIAREAGVGLATLYRHFPTRESLVDAVYQDQVHRLTVGASQLLTEFPAAEAMRRWMDVFADWVSTKAGMLPTMLAMIDAGEMVHAQSRGELLSALTTILDAGREQGDIRADANAEDVAASLAGLLTAASTPEQSTRLLDLLMDGLRPAGCRFSPDRDARFSLTETGGCGA